MARFSKWLKSFKEDARNIRWLRHRLCEQCGKDLLKYWFKGGKIWSRKTSSYHGKQRNKLYCEECYNDLYNGIKYRVI